VLKALNYRLDSRSFVSNRYTYPRNKEKTLQGRFLVVMGVVEVVVEVVMFKHVVLLNEVKIGGQLEELVLVVVMSALCHRIF
jgi:hypothetical protein